MSSVVSPFSLQLNNSLSGRPKRVIVQEAEPDNPANPISIEFDATLSETHAHNAEVTSHPVETGVELSDHVILRPFEITINGIVTDTPVGLLPTLSDPILRRGGSRVSEAYKILKNYMSERKLLNLATTLDSYNNLFIVSLSVTRDARNGSVLNSTIVFRQIEKVKQLSVPALRDPVDPSRQDNIDIGEQSKNPKGQALSTPEIQNTRGIAESKVEGVTTDITNWGKREGLIPEGAFPPGRGP